jgi:Tol biopolymer transport system component
MMPTTPRGSNLTAEGTILGTFQYMAPEQLEGKEADTRTDIFAFGAVLYEMVAGRKAFSGGSQASLISSIMTSDPPSIGTLQPTSPPALDRVIRTCLAKDPEDRWQSAHDVGRELKWIAEGSAAGMPAVTVSRRRSRERLAWLLAAVSAAGAIVLLFRGRAARPEGLPASFSIVPPGGSSISQVQLSPDGSRLAFTGEDAEGRTWIWVRPLDSLDAHRLEGTRVANGLIWSPDSRSIAFFQAGRLRRVDAEGGAIQTICESGSGFGASWSKDGRIVFGSNFGDGLMVVPASGGTPSPATTLDQSRGDATHSYPSFLPDGTHFVFVARNVDPEKTVIALGDLSSRETRPLFHSDSAAVWAPPGYLLFAREGALFAEAFDPKSLKTVGEPKTLARNVRYSTDSNGIALSASENMLVYSLWQHEHRLVWVDRKGREQGTLGQVADYEDVEFSPDGRRVAASIRDPSRGQNLDLWVLDVGRGNATRLTTERSDEFNPVWTPDGQKLFYVSDRHGYYDLYSRPASGGPEEVVLQTKWDKVVSDVTPDGSSLLFNGSPSGHGEDIWLAALGGGKEPKPLTQTPGFVEIDARVSRDGRWIAFASNESGHNEIYVQPFPSGQKKLASEGGGSLPVWTRDGKELFYVAIDDRLMAVSVSVRGGVLEFGVPQPLFELRAAGTNLFADRQYDVAPDGERFLVVRRVGQERADPLVVEMNWRSRLKN